MVWGFLATFFFFAGIGAVAGIIYGTIKGFPLLIDGLKDFFSGIAEIFKAFKDLGKSAVDGAKEGWESVDWDGNPKDPNS